MTDKQKQKTIAKRLAIEAQCAGCGEKINAEEDDLSKIEYVRTKRKTDIFFHRGC